MSFNLIDAAKGLFTPALVRKASAYLGENENTISKAISGIIPATLAGITERATASHDEAVNVINLAKESDGAGFLDNMGTYVDEQGGDMQAKASGVLGNIFGEGTADVLGKVIAKFSGAKTSTVTSLLGIAVPAILAMLGRHAKSNSLDAEGLRSMLNGQKGNIVAAMPPGIDLSSVFSGSAGRITAREGHAQTAMHATYDPSHTPVHHYASDTDEHSGGGLKLLFPVILLALLGMGAWYFFKDGCHGKDVQHAEMTHNDSTPATQTGMYGSHIALGKLDSLSGDFVYEAGETSTIQLPGNAGSLTVGRNTTEYKLLHFLNDKNAALDTVQGNWFEFTNVRFQTGGSDVTETSLTQLKNLVLIAKAFPTALFKIGGYTDNSGDSVNNTMLSQRRADAVFNKLKSLGMPAASLETAKGYGPAWPLADNATAEGRAQNRRVAVNVKAK